MTLSNPASLPFDPDALGEAGEKIYNERYRAQYEAEHFGKFVAINLDTGDAILGDTPEEALQRARAAFPSSFFHLIKVGSPFVFRL